MCKQTKISDSEWKVMTVLWEKYPMTSSQIINQLQETNWNPNTIHTLLSRLVKKNIIGVKRTTRFKEYYPLVTQEECRLIESRNLIKKAYNGSIKMFLASYINQDELSSEDINYLMELLKNRETDRREKDD